MRCYAFFPLLALPSAIAENMTTHITNGLGSDFRSSQLHSATSRSVAAAVSTIPFSSSASPYLAIPSTTVSPAVSDEMVAIIPLQHELINQPLGRFGKTAHLGGASVDVGVPVNCLNCSTFGQIEVTAGEFDLFSEVFNDDDLAFSNGHFRAAATGLAGHFEFSLESITLSHVFTLLKIPAPIGFVVPGLGDAGVVFELDLSIGLEFQALTNLTFGFEYFVPNGAFIDIDIADIRDSTSYGFLPDEGLEIRALPVHVDTHGLDFAITAALTPKLQVGFSFFENSTSATAAVLLNIPALRLEEKQLSNVDSNCQPILNDSSSLGEDALIGDATSFIPSAGFNLGVGAQAGFRLDDFSFSNGTTTMLASTTLTFPGTCIQNGHTATFNPKSTQSVVTGIPTKAHTASAISASALFATATGPVSTGAVISNQTTVKAPCPITSLTFTSGTATATGISTARNVTAPISATPSPYIPTAGAPMTHVGGAAMGLFWGAGTFTSL